MANHDSNLYINWKDMKEQDEEQAQLIFIKAMADVDDQLHKFRYDNAKVIASCLERFRYEDLIKMIYKAGFFIRNEVLK